MDAERAERLRALPYSGWATNARDRHSVGVADDPRATRRFDELERALGGRPPAVPDRELIALLRGLPGSPWDVLHANAVRALDRAVTGLGRAGDLLVSVCELDLVAVVDPVRRRLRWSWDRASWRPSTTHR